MAKKFKRQKSKTKKCSKCNKRLPILDFYPYKRGASERLAVCKWCYKRYYNKHRKRYAEQAKRRQKEHPILHRRRRQKSAFKNRKKIALRGRKWYLKNRIRILKQKREDYAKNAKRLSKLPRSFGDRYRNIRSSARSRRIPFLLSFEEYIDVVKIGICYYCGTKIGVTSGGSLDRVNNDYKIGYRRNNVVCCCIFCNKLKYTMSRRKFFNHILKIARFNKLI